MESVSQVMHLREEIFTITGWLNEMLINPKGLVSILKIHHAMLHNDQLFLFMLVVVSCDIQLDSEFHHTNRFIVSER